MIIGKLVKVSYNQLTVKISSEIRGGSVAIRGDVYHFGNIGSYLKLNNALEETIICEVVSIFDTDMNREQSSFDVESNRELWLKPIGTITKDKGFNLGVGIYPSLYSDVSIVVEEDMKNILKTNIENGNEDLSHDVKRVHKSFPLGISKNLINYPIEVNIDSFFNIHTAVLGNTGSGKSNTIAHILQEIHKKEGYSAIGKRILLFDVNGEYKNAFDGIENKNRDISVKYLKPKAEEVNGANDEFYLPHFLMTLDEWSAFLLATDATQRPFWDKVLQEAYRFYKIGDDKEKYVSYFRHRIVSMISSVLGQANSDTVQITTVASLLRKIEILSQEMRGSDSTLTEDISSLREVCTLHYGNNKDKVQKKLEEISGEIDMQKVYGVMQAKLREGEYFDYKFLKVAADMILLEEDARGNKQIRTYTATMMTRLDYFIDNPNCLFMRAASNSIKDADGFRGQLWEDNSKKIQLAIIDTSELSPDILETLTSVTSRLIFDERRKLHGAARREEPIHLILDEAHRYIKKNYDYIIKENIFEKIAREGRKFSYYLIVSSQRPSELSETVISQCGNFIIHRIQNEADMRYIQAVLPYFSEDFVNKIKQSIPGEALVFGNCVSMPLHLRVYEANPKPDSENCKISEEWFKEFLEDPSDESEDLNSPE